jgi:cysteinyl-tRNA synthetase
MMQAHYRSVLDFSDEAIIAAEKGFNRLMEAIDALVEIKPATASTIDINSWKQACYDAMNDDFNSPILIAQLFDAVRYINLLKDGKESISAADLRNLSDALHAFVFDVLGLKNENAAQADSGKLEGVVNMLIGMRNEARANKNFQLSDEIRNKLTELGIELKDSKEGTTFSVHN